MCDSDGTIFFTEWDTGESYGPRIPYPYTSASSQLMYSYYSMAAMQASSGRRFVTRAASNQVAYSDNGTTWNTVNCGSNSYGSYLFQTSTGRIFISNYNGATMAYSDDNGASWSNKDVTGYKTRAMCQAANGTLIVATETSGTTLYSTDDGDTWNVRNTGGQPNHAESFITLPSGRICSTVSYSDDNGLNWTGSSFNATLNNTIGGARSLFRGASGILVVSSRSASGQQDVFISRDDGVSYQYDTNFRTYNKNIRSMAVGLNDIIVLQSGSANEIYVGTPNY